MKGVSPRQLALPRPVPTGRLIVGALAALGVAAGPAAATPVPKVLVKAPAAPLRATLGATTSTTVTLTNKGTGTSKAGTLRVYLSTDKTKSRGAFLAKASVAPIKAGKRAEVVLSAAVPATLPAGSYRVLAALDTNSTQCTVKTPCSRDGSKSATNLTVVQAPVSVPPPAPASPASPADTPPLAVSGVLVTEHANDGSATTVEDQPVAVHLTASPTSAAYEVITGPQHGALSGSGADRTYTPAANFSGDDRFTFKASCAEPCDSRLATFTLHVTAVNDPPLAVADAYTLDEDTVLTLPKAGGVTANDSDAEGDSLTTWIVGEGGPDHGDLEPDFHGGYTYTPHANFSGQDQFWYRLNDGHDYSAVVTVTIHVTAVNDPPVAVADAYNTDADQPQIAPVRENDTDAESDPLTVTAITQGANGSVVIDAITGNPVYTPDAGFDGTDSFTYTVSDGHGGSSTGSVTVTTLPPL